MTSTLFIDKQTVIPADWANDVDFAVYTKLRDVSSSITNGDASKTLIVGTDGRSQRWTVTLTATRTATLSLVNAVAGNSFIITRDATSVGNFLLNVVAASLTIMALATG